MLRRTNNMNTNSEDYNPEDEDNEKYKINKKSVQDDLDIKFYSKKIIAWLRIIAIILVCCFIVLSLILVCFVYISVIAGRINTTVNRIETDFDIEELGNNATIIMGQLKTMSIDPIGYTLGSDNKDDMTNSINILSQFMTNTATTFNSTEFTHIAQRTLILYNNTLTDAEILIPEAEQKIETALTSLQNLATRISGLFSNNNNNNNGNN